MILLYFSIFKAADFDIKHELELRMTENPDNTNLIINNPGNIITVGAEAMKEPTELLKINIMPIKSRKFEKFGGSVVKKDANNIFLGQKFRFNIHFNISAKKVNTDFTIKRSLQEILNFHALILTKFDKISYKSPLMIQLKNLTDIFINCPEAINRDKVILLEQLYIKLSKHFIFFISELIKFAEINNTFLESVITDQLINNFTYNYDNALPIHKQSTLDSEGAHTISEKRNNNDLMMDTYKSNTINNSDFFSDIDRKSIASNDLTKTMAFINNILTQDNFLSSTITDIKNFSNYNDCVIYCEIKLNNSKRQPVVNITIQVAGFIKYLDSKKTFLHKELYKALKEMKNRINKEGLTSYKTNLQTTFNEFLNDLFYLDNHLFLLFDINKSLVSYNLT
jgi:hypothetical protein